MEEVLKKSLPRCMNKSFSLLAWRANTREGWGSERKGKPDLLRGGKRWKKRQGGPLGEPNLTEKRSMKHTLSAWLDA